jgi:hypothetical protein
VGLAVFREVTFESPGGFPLSPDGACALPLGKRTSGSHTQFRHMGDLTELFPFSEDPVRTVVTQRTVESLLQLFLSLRC